MEGLVVMSGARPDAAFWRGRRVLLTGHSGFKGGWLAIWLHRLGARVTGLSLPPDSDPNLYSLARVGELCDSYFADIRDAGEVLACMQAARPEVVFHLAAQALVMAGYSDPPGTYATNVMGTVHVLEAIRRVEGVRVAVMVTTDKVYRNREWSWAYREDDELGGHDPYSASKAASEIAIASYRAAFLANHGVAIGSARAGNVIGGGDWARDRLLPDAMRAWISGQPLIIRRPDAVRPWQHVLEPLAGYLVLAQTLWSRPDAAAAYNFGPAADDAATVRHVVELARRAFGRGEVHCVNGYLGPHEAGQLSLENAKARTTLNVTPRWRLARAIEATTHWYRQLAEGADARSLCTSQIEAYEAFTP